MVGEDRGEHSRGGQGEIHGRGGQGGVHSHSNRPLLRKNAIYRTVGTLTWRYMGVEDRGVHGRGGQGGTWEGRTYRGSNHKRPCLLM